MRRRLALLLVPVALVLLWFRPRVPAERSLSIRFGARAASLREADLHFERGGTHVRDLTLYFPRGAEREVSRTVRLPAGDYDVGVRLVFEGEGEGRERHVSRPVHADADDPVELDLDLK